MSSDSPKHRHRHTHTRVCAKERFKNYQAYLPVESKINFRNARRYDLRTKALKAHREKAEKMGVIFTYF